MKICFNLQLDLPRLGDLSKNACDLTTASYMFLQKIQAIQDVIDAGCA